MADSCEYGNEHSGSIKGGKFLTQPPILWVPGSSSLGVKRPGHEADHSPPSAEVKTAWCYTSSWRGP